MSEFISLKKYFLEELNIKAPLHSIPENILNVEMSTNLSFGKNKSADNLYMVTLSCSVNYKEIPEYKINAKINGIFETGKKCINDDMRDRLLSNGAASTLYGALREVVRAVTCSTIYPPLILPIIHFEEKKISFEDE